MERKFWKACEILLIVLAVACGIRAIATREVTLASYLSMTTLFILTQLEVIGLTFDKKDA